MEEITVSTHGIACSIDHFPSAPASQYGADQTHSTWVGSSASITRVHKLGEGGFGEVFQVAVKSEASLVAAIAALKVVRFSTDRTTREHAFREGDIHCDINKLQCPYILIYHAGIAFQDMVFHLLEYCPRKYVPSEHSLEVNLEIYRGVALGVDLLHLNGIVHRDIKPENILLQIQEIDGRMTLVPKLADFGLSEYEARRNPLERSGTPSYFPPEYFSQDPCILGYAHDVWSMGRLFHDAILPTCGKELWESANNRAVEAYQRYVRAVDSGMPATEYFINHVEIHVHKLAVVLATLLDVNANHRQALSGLLFITVDLLLREGNTSVLDEQEDELAVDAGSVIGGTVDGEYAIDDANQSDESCTVDVNGGHQVSIHSVSHGAALLATSGAHTFRSTPGMVNAGQAFQLPEVIDYPPADVLQRDPYDEMLRENCDGNEYIPTQALSPDTLKMRDGLTAFIPKSADVLGWLDSEHGKRKRGSKQLGGAARQLKRPRN